MKLLRATAAGLACAMPFTLCFSCSLSPGASASSTLSAGAPNADLGGSGGGDGGNSGDGGSSGAPDLVSDAGAPTVVPGAAALVIEVDRILAAARVSSYTHTPIIDESKGVFELDCSEFVDYALSRALPDAFAALLSHTGRPANAASITRFLGGLSTPVGRWRGVKNVRDLTPGDVVAWLQPVAIISSNTGHVLVVREPPVERAPSEFLVVVVDSTESPHGKDDTRAPSATGVGRGEIVLVADSSGAPFAFRWSALASSLQYSTTIALGHLD